MGLKSHQSIQGECGRRANVLFILSDDQGHWAMRCAGNGEIETPNLDRLAASGTRFDRFFCASPVCSPARASLLTGRMPSGHGVHDYLAAGNTIASFEPVRGGELIEYLKGQPGYTDILAAAGYGCGISGKWHLGDAHHPQKGFEFWSVHAQGGGPYYGAPMVQGDTVREEPGYVTDFITDEALRWLEERGTDARPFYLGVHYTAPHSPWSRNQHPADLYDRYHESCPFASVPDGLAPPAWVRRLSIPVADAATRRAHLSGYFAAVTAMDRNIGRLLDWLEAHDFRNDTLVVFTSDNGMNMGHHGVYGKGNATLPLNMFEESVRVPFLAAHPGRVPAGRVCDALLSQVDFLPTLLDYVGLGAAAPGGLPGRSFSALLEGRGGAPREHVAVYDEYGPVRMVRTREWKYVCRNGDGPTELYDLACDPDERVNLAGHPGQRAMVDEMAARLRDWFGRFADPAFDGWGERVTGRGQIGRCGTRSAGRSAFRAWDDTGR